MKKIFYLLTMFSIFVVGCKKEENPIIPPSETSVIFTTGNVKLSPAYFNFSSKDTNKTTYDVIFGTVAVPLQPGAPPAVFPAIKLNRAKNVKAIIIDGALFESINADTVTNLKADPSDTTFVIGDKCFSYDGATHKLNTYTNRTFIVQTVLKEKILN